ncbi:MAG: ABC transporter permease [Saprospiraceae bacterium]
MLTYLLKRISTLLLSLWIISVCLFFLQKNATVDVVMLQSKARSNGSFYVHPLAAEKVYRAEAVRLNLDRPLFYFAMKPVMFPDTFYKVQYPEAVKVQKKLLLATGDWALVQTYFQTLTAFYEKVAQTENGQVSIFWKQQLQEMANTADLSVVKAACQASDEIREPYIEELRKIEGLLIRLSYQSPSFFSWLPFPRWNGFDNQFHLWFSKIIHGDIGISSRDGRPVLDKLKEAIPWTLWVNGLAILLAYMFAMPVGILMAVLPKSRWLRWINNFLLALYALPAFWVGSMLLFQATLPEYGFSFFSISGWSGLQREGGFLSQPIPFLLQLSLPVFCMSYGLAAYLTSYMQSTFSKVLKEPYMLFAKTKGISRTRLYFKHALPNALLPQIVFVAGIIPALITGSVVIEVIFNIPGMGRLFIDSMLSQDFTTVYSFVLLVSVLTAVGLIVSDILLVVTDPRIRLSRENRNE